MWNRLLRRALNDRIRQASKTHSNPDAQNTPMASTIGIDHNRRKKAPPDFSTGGKPLHSGQGELLWVQLFIELASVDRYEDERQDDAD